jgi:hypothetical protein
MLNIYGGAAAEPPCSPWCVPSGTRFGTVAREALGKEKGLGSQDTAIGEVHRIKQEEGRGVVEVVVCLPSADGCTSDWWPQPCSRFEHSACHHSWTTSAARPL